MCIFVWDIAELINSGVCLKIGVSTARYGNFNFFRYQWIWGVFIVKVFKHPVNPDETKPSLSIGDPQNSDNHHERKSILTHLHELRLHSQPRKGNRNIISIKPCQ